jgi:hypothetical protein
LGVELFRKNWRHPGFWRWWWQNRVTASARILAGTALLALLLVGGWFGATYLTTAGADPGANDSYVLETTVQRVVTVHEKGKIIRKIIPVVKRVVVPSTAYRPTTQYGTQLVTVNGQTRVVRQPIVRYVPRVRDRLVTVNRRTTTIRTRTQTAIVTSERTVTATQVQTRTDERTVTNTDTQYRTTTDTRTLTETSPPVTVTLPAETVTVVETVTVKH